MAQLFIQRHYDTFRGNNPHVDNNHVRHEREMVRDQFLWLEGPLTQYISQRGWDLHRHHQTAHLTSSTHFVWINNYTGEVSDDEGVVGEWTPIVKEISALWLHYGKSKDQLNLYKNLSQDYYQFKRKDDSDYYNAFYIHCRIQFFLNAEHFGAGVLFTKNDRFDKWEFKLRLLRDKTFPPKVKQALKPLLGKGFYFYSNEEEIQLTNQVNLDDVMDALRLDDPRVYSGISRIYVPDDQRISVENIVQEMQGNLDLLFPLYDLMATRQNMKLDQVQQPSDISRLAHAWGGRLRK